MEQYTIYTSSIDGFVAMVAVLARTLKAQWCMTPEAATEHILQELPVWCQIGHGLDDLPDAFRGCPTKPADQRGCLTAVWNPHRRCWLFGIMWGAPLGIGKVVLHFNRLPVQVTAFARRVMGLMTVSYFDDIATLSFVDLGLQEQQACSAIFLLHGAAPKPSKSCPVAVCRPYLGAVLDYTSLLDTGEVRVTPKFVSRQRVLKSIRQCIKTRVMSKGIASKIRGRSGWVASNTQASWEESDMEV